MDLAIATNYFNYLAENNEFISKGSNKALLVKGLLQHARFQNDQSVVNSNRLEERGIFTLVVKYFGGGCSLQAAGYIADAGVSAALALATAETGVGLAVGLASAAGNYANAITTVLKC